MKLKKALQEFVKEHPQYETQAGALYQCDWASGEFINWLRERYPSLYKYHNPRIYTFYVTESEALRFQDTTKANPDSNLYTLGHNESGQRKSSWHCIVETKNFYIDLTARQYTEAAAYPHLIKKIELVMAARAGK